MEKYFALSPIGSNADPKVTHMKVDMHYSKGGLNVFTYKQERRGYYISFQPIRREGIMESFIAFSGVKFLIREVSRASSKQEREAEQEAERFVSDHLATIARNMGYELGEEEQV